MNTVSKAFAYNIKYYRSFNGWTQEDCSSKAMLSTRQYQKLEGGEANPTMATLDSLAKVFKVTVDQLLRITFYRTTLSPEKFLKSYRKVFEKAQVGAGIRDLNGLVLWGNQTASENQGGRKTYVDQKVNLLTVLEGAALEIMKNQLLCEQRGLINPYMNYVDKGNGERIYLRYYPTLILPENGMQPYYASVYLSGIESDCQKNYYQYCEKLLSVK